PRALVVGWHAVPEQRHPPGGLGRGLGHVVARLPGHACMVVRDTGNLQLPVSLTEIRAPLAGAAARLRAQPLRPALLVGGVALAFALLLSVLGGTLAARQQSLHRTLEALPQSERGFVSARFGVPLDPGGSAQADRRARRALAALGAGGTRRVVLFRELRVQG